MTVFVIHIPVGTGDSGHVWCPLHADESAFTRERVILLRQTERSEVINAGRQLLMICVHKVFLLVNMLIMSAKMLSVLSDRGRQTYRSENVQTVTGILLPTAVRPAPFFLFLHSQVSGYLRGSDAPGGLRDMEVKVCLPQ